MNIKRIILEAICILVFALFVAMLYNAISPTGIELIRHKQKEARGPRYGAVHWYPGSSLAGLTMS